MTGDPVHLVDDAAVAGHAAALAAALRRLEVAPGDVVAALAGNHPGFLAARDAATALDLVFAPINPRLAPPEVAWIAGHARPRAVLTDRAHASQVPAGTPVIVVDDVAPVGPGSPGPPPGLALDPTRIGATLLYTSGTTGRPKGCLRPEPAETARAAELRATYGLHRDDVHLIACPLAHSAPGIFARAARAAGASTVIVERFRPRAFLDAAVRTRATVFFLVPTQWHRLLELPAAERAVDLGAVRIAIVAGAPMAPAVKDRIGDWLGPDRLCEFYGSSETGTVTVAGPDDHRAAPGSVGRPPPGVSVRLLDDAGRPVATGQPGEVYVRSDALMAGYLDEHGAVTRPGERDGHISVGDLGRLDDAGRLTLVDRKHDTILSGGANVYPAEVERVLTAHPAVAGAVVFGTDDPEWGQVVTALIAARAPGRLDLADLIDFVRARLAGYKLPRRWAACAADQLPIGGSGKALRRAARDGWQAGRWQLLTAG